MSCSSAGEMTCLETSSVSSAEATSGTTAAETRVWRALKNSSNSPGVGSEVAGLNRIPSAAAMGNIGMELEAAPNTASRVMVSVASERRACLTRSEPPPEREPRAMSLMKSISPKAEPAGQKGLAGSVPS